MFDIVGCSEKAARRERIHAKLAAQMKEKAEDEGVRISRAVEEEEERKRVEENEKTTKRLLAIRSIEEHHIADVGHHIADVGHLRMRCRSPHRGCMFQQM